MRSSTCKLRKRQIEAYRSSKALDQSFRNIFRPSEVHLRLKPQERQKPRMLTLRTSQVLDWSLKHVRSLSCERQNPQVDASETWKVQDRCFGTIKSKPRDRQKTLRHMLEECRKLLMKISSESGALDEKPFISRYSSYWNLHIKRIGQQSSKLYAKGVVLLAPQFFINCALD